MITEREFFPKSYKEIGQKEKVKSSKILRYEINDLSMPIDYTIIIIFCSKGNSLKSCEITLLTQIEIFGD